MHVIFCFSLHHLINSYLIEFILCLQTVYYCLAASIGQYIYDYYLQSYSLTARFHNETVSLTTDIVSSKIQFNSRLAQQWAQEQSSSLVFYQAVASSIPTIVMTYVLGLYTHELGRKFILILTMFGNTCQYIIWLLIIYYQLPGYWWYIAAFLASLAGGGNVSSFILNLIITDSTKESQRTSKFLYIGALCTSINAITSLIIGFWIDSYGYVDLYWSALFIQILTILIVYNYMKTESLISIQSKISHQNLSMNNKYRQFIEICTVFSPRHTYRSRKRTISLIITIVAFVFHCLASLALSVPFLWFQLNSPFCWTAKEIGYYNTVASIVWCIGSIIGMKFFNYIRFNDVTICCISHLFFIISALWTAQAISNWQLYVGLLISPFTCYQSTLTYSIISKWIEPNEITHVYTFVTGINTILNVFGNSFFNYLYSITVSYSRTLIFSLAAALGCIPFGLNLILYFITKTMSDVCDHRITEYKPILIPDHISIRAPVGMKVQFN